MVATRALLCSKNERQRRFPKYLGKCKGCAATLTHTQTISSVTGKNDFDNIVTVL
jgi:hypothetical protein